MGTLASELGGYAEQVSGQPRVYVDANVPAGLVSFMRQVLRWDVFFVLEHEELRRAPDGEHYRLARQLRRTLITQDRDYLDDRKFPPEQSGGVLVMWAPVEKGLMALLKRVDREVLRRSPTTVPTGSLTSPCHSKGASFTSISTGTERESRRDRRQRWRPDSVRAPRQRGVADHRRWPHHGDRVASCRSGRSDDRRRERLLRSARLHRCPRARPSRT